MVVRRAPVRPKGGRQFGVLLSGEWSTGLTTTAIHASHTTDRRPLMLINRAVSLSDPWPIDRFTLVAEIL